ncbi:MAG: DUF4013 domain-containing protein [Nanoarchaeota archaeon]|nr:DUF4013 domain-containing protein [Nanoarchaeota archaeon]
MAKKVGSLSIEAGLKYPWGKAKRLWNILWVLIPVFGWFALIGYVRNIVLSIVKGNTKELPEFGKFWDNFFMGLKLFIFLIPLMVVIMLLNIVPFVGAFLAFFAQVLVLPYIIIHLFVTDKFESTFDYNRWWRVVGGNFTEYLVAFLKTLVYAIVYGLLSFVLIGIPCYAFGMNIYIAEFYAKYK